MTTLIFKRCDIHIMLNRHWKGTVNNIMDTARDGIINLGRSQYLQAIGYYDLEKDDEGFVVLKPTASRVDKKVATLTTDISALEQQLRKFKAEKAEAVRYQKTDEYKESKKNEKKKKNKKAKENILNMVFNNADAINASEEADEDDGYKDNKKKGPRKPKDTTRDTTMGKRYEPIISMLYDSVADFEKIANEIDAELATNKTRNMYRSTQIGNLLSAKDKKMAAIKELRSIADKITDYEYKEKTAKAKTEESDSSKAVSAAAAKFLRGAIFDDDDDSKGKKGKKKGKEESSFKRQGKKQGVLFDDDDDDDDEDRIERKRKKAEADDDMDLAKALASELNKRGGASFTNYERLSHLEGTYKTCVLCDAGAPEKDWRYVAIDPKNGKILKGDDYKSLLPRRKDARPVFNISKKQMVDKASGRRYPLLFKE